MKSAFTLIELAIVIIIIALLIAGVLAGRSLIESAKTIKLMRQISELQLSINTFKTKFTYLPGDHPSFSNFYPDETVYDGNGNGLINTFDQDDFGSFEYTEDLSVFHHLTLVGLIKGTYQGYMNEDQPYYSSANIYQAEYSNDTLLWIGDGSVNTSDLYTVFEAPYSAVPPAAKTPFNTLMVGGIPKDGNGDYFNSYPVKPTIKLLAAYSIDKKMDDGVAYKGNVRGFDDYFNYGVGVQTGCPVLDDDPADYNLTVSPGACVLAIKLD